MNIHWSDLIPYCRTAGGVFLALLIPFLLASNRSLQAAEQSVPVSFNEDIRPILSENCFFCHGPDPENREADLRLDERQVALDYLAIVPGKPEESELIRRLETAEPDEVMPPPHSKRQVSAAQIDLLKRWISEGANYQEHWSFKPLQTVSVPSPQKSGQQGLTSIDAFLLQRLQEKGWQYSPPASKETLIRRVSYDLTGLPPTVQQIDQFLADDSPEAYEKLVDRLLASPHYGERMTSEWLDVARYSDSYGYQVDRDRYVWPWRDWVIRAFNRNLPYDQFITEQLAGDLLPQATDEQILATTFNRLHPQKVEGGSVPEEFRIEYIADRTQTFGTAFLGLTVECARCHTHKYDPITQKEYYQLSSFFDNIDEAGLYSFFTDAVPTPTLLLATDAQKQQMSQLETEILQAEQSLLPLAAEQEAAFQQWLSHKRTLVAETSSSETIDVKHRENSPAKNPPAEKTSAPHPLIPGRIAVLDFESAPAGGNKQVPGKQGAALQLTGDDAVNLNVGNFKRYEPFSVALWLQTPDVKERAVIYHRSRAWTDAASRGYELLLEEGCLSAALIHYWPGNALRVKTVHPIPVGEWLHVAVVYDGSSRAAGLQIFINGQPAECEVIRDKLTKNITGGGGDHIAIGERFRDRGFKGGLVDEFQVFQRQLTPLEVLQLFDGQALQQALQQPEDQLQTEQIEQLREFYLSVHNETRKQAIQQLQQLRQKRSELVDPIQEIMVMRETPEPVPSHLLLRGVYDAKGEQVFPEVIAQLHPYPEAAPRNRLGLAQWLTSPQNPLTARVTVNRYWQMIFGEGLVRTPEDFGSQGQAPTHPLLLDWLAKDFIDEGWNVQRLLKQMVMTQAYRQSSEITPELLAKDPENRWLTRFASRRLPAEMVRDTALAVSGLLVDKIGGPPVMPYEVEASFKPSPRSTGEGLYRRSLYTYWKRNAPAPVMLALDASVRDVCRVKRDKTMSPLQAFVLLNGPQFVEASRVYAQQIHKQYGERTDELLVHLFRSTTARSPEPNELEILRSLYDKELETFTSHPTQAAELLAVGDRPVDPSLDARQIAALTVVINVLLNFDETQMQR